MKSAFVLVATAAVLTAALAGCASDNTPAGEVDDIHSGPAAGQEGGTCGTIAGITCAAGLRCASQDTHPDAAGTCVKPARGEEGSMCAGFAALPCNEGLTCKVADPHPDAAGVCTKAPGPGEEGGQCGGFAGLRCHEGLSCRLAGSFPDAGGTCERQ